VVPSVSIHDLTASPDTIGKNIEALREELRQKMLCIQTLETENSSLSSNAKKLHTEIDYLTGYIRKELESYNLNIINMRKEMIRIKEENLKLKQIIDLNAQQSLAKGFQSEASNYQRSKTVDKLTQDHETGKKNIKDMIHALKIESQHKSREQSIQPATQPIPKRHLIDSKRTGANKIASRKGTTDQLSYMRCYAAPSLKSSKSELKATDSGFLSRSRESLDFASSSQKVYSTLKDKIVIPKLNTQAIIDKQQKEACNSLLQKQPVSDQKFTSSQLEDRSDSLYISDKMSELAANGLDFIGSLDSGDETSKNKLICDYLDIK
jgi:hypothetical protein